MTFTLLSPQSQIAAGQYIAVSGTGGSRYFTSTQAEPFTRRNLDKYTRDYVALGTSLNDSSGPTYVIKFQGRLSDKVQFVVVGCIN